MLIRRIILWVISTGAGVAGMLAVIFLPPFRSNFEEFQALFPGDLPLLLLVGFGSLVFIWGDLILQTEYLKK